MRKFVLPALVGFALLWLEMQLIAHWLLFSARIGSVAYAAIIWPLMLASMALTAYLAVAACGLAGRAAAMVVLRSVLVSTVLSVCIWFVVATIGASRQARWVFLESASLVWMMLFAVLTVAVSHGFVWLARPRTPPRAASDTS